MSAVADKLRAARALIERGWCQGYWAKDDLGEDCHWLSPEVACVCARGAVKRVSNDVSVEFALADALPDYAVSIAFWNDAPERTQAEVLAAFDRAIELAERGETL